MLPKGWVRWVGYRECCPTYPGTLPGQYHPSCGLNASKAAIVSFGASYSLLVLKLKAFASSISRAGVEIFSGGDTTSDAAAGAAGAAGAGGSAGAVASGVVPAETVTSAAAAALLMIFATLPFTLYIGYPGSCR